MLQWMGGSRRKVSTSRKSTRTRQKQYFEQRKRQKLSAGPEYHEDRRQKPLNHHDELASLDVISLKNLAVIAEECIPPDKNENDVFQERMEPFQKFPKFPLTSIISHAGHLGKQSKNSPQPFPQEGCTVCQKTTNESEGSPKFTPENRHLPIKDPLAEINNSECYTQGNLDLEFSAETVQGSPRKCDENSEDHKTAGTAFLERQKTGVASRNHRKSETNISILDFVDDDQSLTCSEGPPSEEHHVAFSVEGLGKISMKTPVHSPRQPESFQTPTSNSEWMFYSLKIPEDLRPNLSNTDNDSSSDDDIILESPEDAWHVKDYSLKPKSLPYRGKKCTTSVANSYEIQYPFLVGEEFFNEEAEKRASVLGKNDLSGEFHFEEHPFSMDFSIPRSKKTNRRLTYDCGFDDTVCPDNRFADEDWKQFTFPGGGKSSFWNSSIIEERDLFCHDKARYKGFNRSPRPKKNEAPAQSTSIVDAGTGSVSLRSEESCSSAAEGNKRSGWSPTRVGKSKHNFEFHEEKRKKH